MGDLKLLRLSLGFFWGLFIAPLAFAGPDKGYTAILVDKKTNTLEVMELKLGEFKTLKKYHATLGKVKGDKEQEGDLKTPEGIYQIESRLTPPAIKPKFGALAFRLNYPNAFDRIAGRTGFDIMLHATDDPSRLTQKYDSEGCVVVDNQEIREIDNLIRTGLTPVLIFSELTDRYRKPGTGEMLKKFFDSWVAAWEGKNIEPYIASYHSEFVAQGKNKDAWKSYKQILNQKYSEIHVNPKDVLVYEHPKYSMITFGQSYQSKLKNGAWGLRSTGTKILFVAEEEGQPKIIAETFSQRMW